MVKITLDLWWPPRGKWHLITHFKTTEINQSTDQADPVHEDTDLNQHLWCLMIATFSAPPIEESVGVSVA